MDSERDQAAEQTANGGAIPHAGPLILDRQDPAFLAVAYDVYKQMREQGPVVRASFGRLGPDAVRSDSPAQTAVRPTSERYLVTRYDEVVEALLDDRLSSDFRTGMTPDQRARLAHMPEEMKPLAYSMLLLDPPDHTRLRKLVQPNFTGRAMEVLRPRIQHIVDRRLDEIEGDAEQRGEPVGERSMDLVEAFAHPVPIHVISDMLGIPEEDRAQVHGWTAELLEEQGPDMMTEPRRGTLRAFLGYLEELFARKRRDPGEDMISQMAHFRDEGDKLSSQEMQSMVFILFLAGHVTTVNLISNGVVALLTHPAQLALLRADLSLIKSATEETLRYWGPVDFIGTPRFAADDMELAGCPIPRGAEVSMGLASASRDPARFDNPDVFDITRPDANRNLAFGKGVHVCIGAPLARLEAQIAFDVLFRRYPDLRLGVSHDELRLTGASGLRGFEQVPVLF